MHSRRSPPSFAANLLYHPETFFFKVRAGDPPHIHKVEASERDALQLPEIFTGSAKREVFGRIGWEFFHTRDEYKRIPVETPWPVRPGVLATCNAFTDGEDVYIYLQSWRQRDSGQAEQQVWTHRFRASYQDERTAPQGPSLRIFIEDMKELAWTENSIGSGEETQIM